MSAYQDFEEKSVDKAVDKACSELGIRPDQLKYDIISHGSSGIFGLVGAKKAVIRVVLPEGDAGAASAEFDPDEDVPEPEDDDKTASALVDEAFGPSEQSPAQASPEGQVSAVDADKRAEIVEWVQGFLDRIIALVSPDSAVSVNTDSEVLRFEIKGGDSARLIGKKGQTLDAIHYLVEKGVYKQYGSTLPIEIDVEGYLEKRRSDLTSLASRLANKALQTGKPMVINRINAQDRRVVHLSLRDNREVRTQSVGNGDLRKLLIMPKKKSQAKSSKSGSE
ncbi:MAG: Jag N-terminal domain-containing protein [Desulfobacteraceae bacterium]|nr:Jag N-terminal domain-containing protein [Desulfobacteraceae bacterium]